MLVLFRIEGHVNHAVEVGTSGALCAIPEATLLQTIGWPENPSKLYPAC